MLDIKKIRENPDTVLKKLQSKDCEAEVTPLLNLDKRRRELTSEVESLKAKRNEFSKEIGVLKQQGKDASSLLNEVSHFTESIKNLDQELHVIEESFNNELSKLPNIPMDEVQCSNDPKDNVFVSEWGKKPSFSFPFKNHMELGDTLKLFDFERAVKLAGTGFVAYRGQGARLEWALLQYMMNIQIKNGFYPWFPPLAIRSEILYGAGQLPKFENQQYKLQGEEPALYLLPTAEVPLTGLHYDEILSDEELPLKYVAYTPCFRREAGAAGKLERGLIRTHQFNKIEMYALTRPEESQKMFEEMIVSAEEILKGLQLHYRIMLLVTGDISFSAAKTVDLEVWLPGQDRYYEVSSISNCTDFQARRSRIRYRKKGEKPELVHTLNGSGLATSRLMVSLLENNQQPDGTVKIPEVLVPYMGGQEVLIP